MSTVSNNNNEAVSKFRAGKRNTAVFLLSKNINQSTPPESLYNYGLMNLFTGNVKNAFKVFRRLIQHFKHNPRLWLRLAECKLEQLRKERLDEFDLMRCKHDIPWTYVGEGSNRKLVLSSGTDKNDPNRSELIIVRECLLNSLMLLKSSGKADFNPSSHPSEIELKKLTLSVLLNLSYVNLCLCEYSSAHQYACEGLNLSPEGTYKALLHLYAGEARIWQDNITDAIADFSSHTHLKIDPAQSTKSSSVATSINSIGNNALGSGTKINNNNNNKNNNNNNNKTLDKDEEERRNSTVAKILLCFNLAVAHALKNDSSKAHDTVRLMSSLQSPSFTPTSHPMLPIKVITLAIYIQLAQGNVDGAISIIKQHLPQYR